MINWKHKRQPKASQKTVDPEPKCYILWSIDKNVCIFSKDNLVLSTSSIIARQRSSSSLTINRWNAMLKSAVSESGSSFILAIYSWCLPETRKSSWHWCNSSARCTYWWSISLCTLSIIWSFKRKEQDAIANLSSRLHARTLFGAIILLLEDWI